MRCEAAHEAQMCTRAGPDHAPVASTTFFARTGKRSCDPRRSCASISAPGANRLGVVHDKPPAPRHRECFRAPAVPNGPVRREKAVRHESPSRARSGSRREVSAPAQPRYGSRVTANRQARHKASAPRRSRTSDRTRCSTGSETAGASPESAPSSPGWRVRAARRSPRPIIEVLQIAKAAVNQLRVPATGCPKKSGSSPPARLSALRRASIRSRAMPAPLMPPPTIRTSPALVTKSCEIGRARVSHRPRKTERPFRRGSSSLSGCGSGRRPA